MSTKKAETYSLDIELINRLNKLSKVTDIPKSRIVTKAINKYVDEQTSKSKGQG